MGRILCLDIGTRRTGVAVTDETRLIAQGLPTLEHRDETRLVEQVGRLITEQEIELVVVGQPLGPDGQASRRSEAVTRFANRLRNRFKLPVELYDERYSTARAIELLDETRGRGPNRMRPASKGRSRKRKQAADRVAAVIILQDYLSEHES